MFFPISAPGIFPEMIDSALRKEPVNKKLPEKFV